MSGKDDKNAMHGVTDSTPWGNYSVNTMARIGIEIGKNP
jgi:hypothetical protein